MAKLSLVAVRLLRIHENKMEKVIEIGIEASKAIPLLLSIPVIMDKLVNREKKKVQSRQNINGFRLLPQRPKISSFCKTCIAYVTTPYPILTSKRKNRTAVDLTAPSVIIKSIRDFAMQKFG